MRFRLLSLLFLVYCCHLIVAVKRMRVDGKSYTVSAYPEDCSKYVMCSDGKCKLETCDPTYVFDPVTSTCTHRIFDPRREITTKPPERRESVLPWSSVDKGNESHIQTQSRSPKWQQTRDDIPSKSTNDWSPWQKATGSEIEQRTQINKDYVPEKTPEQFPEQQSNLEFNQFEQKENLRSSFDSEEWTDSDKKQGNPKDELKYGNRDRSHNTINFEDKHLPKNEDTRKKKVKFEDENLYEGIDTDSTKPRKENLLLSAKPQHKIAKYDSRKGVQCPEHNSTGQFVYPPDCKFFVNCWKGRAFVQPCAPGTHFNPDTLECDFPHKVKCYESESAYYRELPSESQINRHQERLQAPECPPYLTALLPHHGDCTKFVQCANGATYIMDCGPGTVFNPVLGVCDWPRNVKGCENIFKSEEDEKISIPFDSYKYDKAKYVEAKKITCPEDFTGYLPHPTTCKKFLECANGVTYIRDCGPGTAFNPLSAVCDWPYKVPGCKTEETGKETHRIGHSTWSSSSGVRDTSSWSDTGRYNHTTDSRRYDSRPSYLGVSSTVRPTWGPFTTTTLNPPWKALTLRPSYPEHTSSYHDRYGHIQEESRYKDHPPYGSQWESSSGGTRRPFDRDYKSQEYPDRQSWVENQGADKDRQGTRYFDRSEEPWPYEHRHQDHQYGNGYHLPGYHYHHHHHHYHAYGPTTTPANLNILNPSKPISTDEHDQRHDQRYPDNPSASDSHWRPDHDSRHDSRHYDYHHPDYAASSETDQKQFQSHFPPGKHVDDNTQFNNPHNRTRFGTEGNLPANRRTGYNFSPNRQEYGRTNTEFYHPGFNHTSPSTANVLVTGDSKFGQRWNQTQDGSRQDRLPPSWTRQENTTWSQSQNESNFKPSSWRPWDQGMIIQDDKLHQWQSGSDIYQQSTIDRETDAKMAHWPLRANVPLNPKGQIDPGSNRNATLYPNGIYVNRDGIKGHFITKEIDDNEGSSTINQPHFFQPNRWNDTFNNAPQSSKFYPIDNRDNFNNLTGPNNHYPPIPATDLQPPPYHPNNHATFFNTTNSPFVPIVYGRPNYRSIGHSNVSSDLHPFYDQSHDRPNASPLVGVDSHYVPTFNTTTPRIAIPDRRYKPPSEGKIFLNNTRGKESRSSFDESELNLPSVSIEEDNRSSATSDTKIVESEFPIEPEINEYDVDVLDDKNVWKPRLVFQNKTQTTTVPSVIMKIGPKKNDVELFNIEEAPFQEKEPPFPIYYVHPVQPLTHSRKSIRHTPISGQMIRLRGGSGPKDGYVEVQGTQPGWGVVCDSRNSWTLKEAHIVCRQLGYIRGAEMAWQGRSNRNGVPIWIAANTVMCLGNETRFQSCKFTHKQECLVDRDAIGVRCASNRIVHCRKDEIPHEGQCYHLADSDSALNHAEALEYCTRRNARLIDITCQAENNFVSEWLLQSYPEVNSIMTSGFGFTTMNRPLWLWEDSARAKFKFTKWWPGWMNDTIQPPPVGTRPLCIVMKRNFPCHERPESTCMTDYFFWDTEDCAASSKGHSFICEKPYDDIGCIYGKGNQYTGKANVTLSGNECLPWADERVDHQLRINVVNKEIRDKLRMHNYCRNPNPAKESRPWCFIGPVIKREYCDIPACGNIDPKRSMLTGQCKPKHFECTPGECIPSPWVCDGEEDCTNGADEKTCTVDLNLFEKSAKHKLDGYDVEKWLNTPLKTCALRCKEADFTCRSFNHKSEGNVCLLSGSNIGLTGALKPDKEFDYYEMRKRSINCEGMYVCNNQKCINQTQVCNGKNDCDDHSDENICTAENLDYDIRLAGADNNNEGRVEVKIFGHWGQVCDDGFGMINADVICKELGFTLGALEVRAGGFYGNLDPPTRFMVDQLKCRGNESTLRECDFNGWGVHNCQPEEAVGIVCKTAVNTCQEGHWKCDNSPACIPTPFICDDVVDCPDHSDESPEHCDAPFELRLANSSSPLQGRVEVRHHGVWGTVCDDDFTNATAAVICRSLGYGGIAIAKKDGFFGSGEGPIWLDEVFCHGNESQLYRCEHNHWGQHNCDHNEDAGVICSPGDINDSELYWESSELPEQDIDELLPANCGRQAKDFNDDEDLIFAKVVHGSIAPKGTYPWQASIRVRGHSRSSHWCGAVVISPVHVLTAAHCLEGYNKGSYFVRAGDYNTDIDEGTEVEANIEDYYVHEEFRKGHRMNNDIALVLLKGHGISLGKDVMPICLPSENSEYLAGLNCTISGFGSIETGKTTQSKDLRYGWVPLLDQSICRAGYVYGEGAISDGMMCAGYLDEGIDTCDGDSGGPLACYHNGAFTLYGITSWGQHCGKANKPGVYVRVAYYRRWIDQKIRESLAGR